MSAIILPKAVTNALAKIVKGTTDPRYVLDAVLVHKDKIAATNGFWLFDVDPVAMGFDLSLLEEPIIIPGHIIREAAKGTKKKEDLILDDQGTHWLMVGGRKRLEFLPVLSYPEIGRMVFQKEKFDGTAPFNISPTALAAVCEVAKVFYDDCPSGLKFCPSKNTTSPVKIEHQYFSAYVMPIIGAKQ
jgi:hypothetical protein